jgi:hypothetical protein
VVTPALAATIEGSMTLRPSRAAALQVGQGGLDRAGVAGRAPGLDALDHSASRRGSTVSIELSPAESGEASVSVQRLTPTTVMSPVSTERTRLAFEPTSSVFM